jgi:tetratricopeptide (TPR) repeat protein
VLYRDFLRVEEWDQAYNYWKKVYAVAPAADGQRNTVIADGITFMEYFMSKEQDAAKRNLYVDTVFMLYDKLDECYSKGGYMEGLKAFDYYYKYPERATKMEQYNLFKASIDQDGEKANDFIINPFTSLLVELHLDGQIPMEEAQLYGQKIKDVIAYGLENCKGVGCERWEIVNSYAPVRLETFETVRGFYDCAYYMDKYYPLFEANMDDCEIIREVYSRLKWAMCDEADERFKALIRTGNEKCVEEGTLEKAYTALKEARYDEAIALFKQAADEAESNEQKGKIILVVAKIYNAHKRNFPQARKYAREAAVLRPNWGEPYILIGRMYASSGPLCGPGRGWDSQVVVWPAVDMWNKAKQVDPSFAAEANKWIRQYSKYMPKKEDVFIRNLKAGQTFKVGCWIQETTKIRTAD